jgi:hypothetical protein
VSLVTGEERRMAEGATHVASTVEMLDSSATPVEVAVIDEIQMLADRDRGAAWTAAVCGAPASTVVPGRRTGSARPSKRWPSAWNARSKCMCSSAWALVDGAGAVRKLRNLRRGDAVICLLAPRSADVARHDHRAGPVGGHRVRQSGAGSAARPGRALPRRQRPTSWSAPMRWRWA